MKKKFFCGFLYQKERAPMEWEQLGTAADWLCKAYLTLHDEMDSDSRLAIYEACAVNDAALIAVLRKVMGNDLPGVFRAAADELSDLCGITKTGFFLPPDDAGLKLNHMLVGDLGMAAEVLLTLLDQCLPEETETREKLAQAQQDNKDSKALYQKLEEEIKKDQGS